MMKCCDRELLLRVVGMELNDYSEMGVPRLLLCV